MHQPALDKSYSASWSPPASSNGGHQWPAHFEVHHELHLENLELKRGGPSTYSRTKRGGLSTYSPDFAGAAGSVTLHEGSMGTFINVKFSHNFGMKNNNGGDDPSIHSGALFIDARGAYITDSVMTKAILAGCVFMSNNYYDDSGNETESNVVVVGYQHSDDYLYLCQPTFRLTILNSDVPNRTLLNDSCLKAAWIPMHVTTIQVQLRRTMGLVIMICTRLHGIQCM